MLQIHVIDELRTGGAQTHLITMLREEIHIPGHEHHVVSLFGDGELGGQIRELGIAVHVLDLRSYLAKRQFLRAINELQSLFEQLRPGLVEGHLTWSRLLGLFAAWRAKVPVRIGFEQGDIYLNSWKFRMANFLAQACAQRIVACSQALADWAHRTHGIFRSKLFVLHNCVDLTRFSPAGPIATDIVFAKNTTIFAAVGTLGRGVNKRVDVLIRGLADARSKGADVALVVCGDGEQRPELERLAESLGIAPHVKFLGTRSDVPAVLRACDGFCHAAPFEPFGIVAIEAMAIGLPAIVPDSGGIREIIEHGVSGFLYPALDHQALSQAMSTLASDVQLRRTIASAGKREVEQHHTVQHYVSKLYRAYGIHSACREKTMRATA